MNAEELAKFGIRLAARGLKAGLDRGTRCLGEKTGLGGPAGVLREAAHMAVDVTGRTLERMVAAGAGMADLARGMLRKDAPLTTRGLARLGRTVSDTAADIARGVTATARLAGKTTAGGLRALYGLATGDPKRVAEGTARLREHGPSLAKVFLAATLGLGVADVAGLVDLTPDGTHADAAPVADGSPEAEPATHGADFAHAVVATSTAGDLLPAVDADHIPGVENGIAGPAATDELVRLGYREDAVPVADPDRSAAARAAFLQQHGLRDVPPGYEIHHVVPLYAGGADAPENMVLVTEEQHRAIHQLLDARYERLFSGP